MPSRADIEPDELSFGIACFNLTPRRPHTPTPLTGDTYLQQAAETLSMAEGVSNIHVEAPSDFHSLDLLIDLPFNHLDEGPDNPPGPDTWFTITFDLHISRASQTSLLPGRPIHAGTETFRITITRGYFAPVAFVVPVSSEATHTPSESVIAVREYLKQQLSNRTAAPLLFETLGPSPFRVQCYIEEAQGTPGSILTPGTRWNAQYVPTPTYDEFHFLYNPQTFANANAAASEIFDEVADELSLAYRAIQIELRRSRRWHELMDPVHHLMDSYKTTGPKARFTRFFLSRRKIMSSLLALAEYELLEMADASELNDARTSVFKEGVPVYFRSQVEGMLNERGEPAPVEQVRNVMRIFDQYRSERYRSVMLIVSAVLGGAAGALLASYLPHLAAR